MANAGDGGGHGGDSASPPCFLHELDPAYAGLTVEPGPPPADPVAWRKAERERLIQARLVVSADRRGEMAEGIATALDALIGDVSGQVVAVYWPFRGEPDLRGWVARVVERGGGCALPVVVERRTPLQFRRWCPGDRLERGVWNIPIPAEGAPIRPTIVISPVVGFDPACYRLGYGGGYYDRTLAALGEKPLTIGVGYDGALMPTIHPEPHDIPMDAIVTESGVVARRAA